MSEQEKEETTAVAKMPQKTMAQQRRDNEEYFHDPMAMVRAVRSISAKSQWGQNLTSEEAQAFEGVAQSNNVSLTNGTAYVLGGNLYISLQGRLKIAHATGLFGGFTVDRPMSDGERQAYQIKEDEVSWITTAIKFLVVGNGEQQSIQFTDYGRASPSEKNPVAKQNPVEMAMKRARARALKLAFPCGLNSVEECIEAEVIKIEDERNTPRTMNPAETKMEELKADKLRAAAAENLKKAPTDAEMKAEAESREKEHAEFQEKVESAWNATSGAPKPQPEPEPTDSAYDESQDEAFEKAQAKKASEANPVADAGAQDILEGKE